MKVSAGDSVSGNAISSMGTPAPPPVEHTPIPDSHPPPHIYQERVHVSVKTLSEFNSVSSLHHHMLVLETLYQALVLYPDVPGFADTKFTHLRSLCATDTVKKDI